MIIFFIIFVHNFIININYFYPDDGAEKSTVCKLGDGSFSPRDAYGKYLQIFTTGGSGDGAGDSRFYATIRVHQ